MSTPIPEDKMAALGEHIFRGRKIEAIKVYRELTGVGLKEAKDEIERLEDTLRREHPEKFSAPAKGKGCFGAAAALCIGTAMAIYWIASR
jgi:Ribosomal protein L7/L12 C-terminal domain